MAAYDDLNVKRIFVVGIASVVVTAVTALAVQVLYYSMAQWQQSETQAASNYTRQNEILQQQQDGLSPEQLRAVAELDRGGGLRFNHVKHEIKEKK